MITDRRSQHWKILPYQAIILLFLVLPASLTAQRTNREKGSPFVRHYSSRDYAAHTQNFCCLQDHRGLMYFGNFAGILEYDGVSWRLIQTRNQTRVTAMALDASGKLFAGAFNEAGYLSTGVHGTLHYYSLTESLPDKDQVFGEVLQCLIAGGKVHFITSRGILLLEEGKLKSIPAPEPVLAACECAGKIYVQLRNQGLTQFHDLQYKKIPGGEAVTSAMEIQGMVALGNNVLLTTDNQGIFNLSPQGIVPWKTEADRWFLEAKISCIALSGPDQIAVGTQRRGILILNASGNLILSINKASGLGNDYITSLFLDKDQSLWASMNDGLSHIGFPSPFTYFPGSSGLEGGVLSMTRHEGKLMVATYQGLFRYQPETSDFYKIPGIYTACWSVVSAHGSLLAATSQGLYQIRNDQCSPLTEAFSLGIVQSLRDPFLFFIGQTDGLLKIRLENGRVISQEKVPGIIHEIRQMAEDESGRLWVPGSRSGLLRIDYEHNNRIITFDTAQGLVVSGGIRLNRVAGRLVAATPAGVFTYNANKSVFEPGLPLPADTLITKAWYDLVMEDKARQLWTTGGDEKRAALGLPSSNKRYASLTSDLQPISDVTITVLFPEDDGIAWFGGPEGLIQYDPSVKVNRQRVFLPLIRKVVVNNDSLLFSGSFPGIDKEGVPIQPDSLKPVLGHQDNTLLFDFAAPLFDIKGETRYQYMLEGFDKIWSDWTTITQKEYTNLPKGSYVFKVRARDIYGVVSKECSYAFRIRTPWYATVVAYVIYVLLALGIIFLIIRMRSRQLMKEKKALENLIQERTLEVVQKKEEIEEQSLELAHKNEELERINTVVKSINAQIHFTHLLQSILEKLMVIKGVEKATAIVHDKASNQFRIKAGIGWDIRQAESESYSLDQLERPLIHGSDEVSEDIFLKTGEFSTSAMPDAFRNAVSMLIVIIRLDDKVEGFLTLENTSKKEAYDQKDISFLSNLRQHIISAFIKTGLLEDLQKTLDELKDTQDQLVQSEKLASLGQLTAGIAHEIQNPLNFVNNFATLSADLVTEMKENLDKLKETVDEDTRLDMEDILNMIDSNVKKIHEHGKRAESIVKGMLQHSRGRTGEFELTDINNMVSEYVNLAYHGMRAKDKSFNTAIKTELDPEVGKINVVPQDLSRVILNIVNNSCYAVDQKAKSLGSSFRPEITVTTKKAGKFIEITIRDNGTGIPASVLDKIFNPFFTTKPTGKGTGLGLSMSFDIIKQIHKGKLEVKTEEGQYTEFIISIPENIQK